VTAFERVPHLTGIVSISGRGVLLAPIIILENLEYLRKLANYDTHCLFTISTNGSMTMDLWVYDTLIFCAQISHYRLSLPLVLRDEVILLILDGHKTRLSLLAALIFEMNGGDVLVVRCFLGSENSGGFLSVITVCNLIKKGINQSNEKRALH
jgi:hypothetical protein